jgi:hypothetical protein
MLFSKASLMVLTIAASANGAVDLGTAAAYGVLGGSTITNTGLTVIGAPIGLSPGSSITGFPPGIDKGEDINNGPATQAKADAETAYQVLAGLPSSKDLTGTDLGGQTLLPGVYTFSSSGGLTGTLTLDGGGAANSQFVFQFGSTITTASVSSVVLINGAQACNVFWQVGSSATLGTGTKFLGNVVARTSITVTTGVSLSQGGFYALDGAVTLDTNSIDPNGACGALPATPSSATPSSASPTNIVTLSSITVTTPSIISITPLPSVVTITTTSTKTNSASTTTITISVPVTVTQTVSASTFKTTCTSTTTKWTTKPQTTTASATKCPTGTTSTKKATSTTAKSSKTSTKTQNYKRAKASTSTHTVTTTCAGYTKTQRATHTVKATQASTSTVWHTKQATTTSTSTYYPSCTSTPKAKRDYERMFG